jgi:hypothetical protein
MAGQALAGMSVSAASMISAALTESDCAVLPPADGGDPTTSSCSPYAKVMY